MQPINYEKKATRCKQTPVFLAYIAGIIDGEGSIFIAKVLNKKSGTWQHILRVTCGMCDEAPIRLIRGAFNYNSRTCLYRQGRKESYRPIYQWIISGPMALNFLRKIEPYLLVKRKQALLGIKFQEDKNNGRSNTSGGRKVSGGTLNEREKDYLQMKVLNGTVLQQQRLSVETTEEVEAIV